MNVTAALNAIRRCVGPGGWTDDLELIAPRLSEWRDRFHGRTALLVQPATTTEVSEVLRIANQARIGVVPQGGNTGLCGGAIPDDSGTQLLLCMGRMNRIIDVDPVGDTITAEAGCVLAALQQSAQRVGRLFALSLAAEGSAQIGGCVATNAGGNNVLRYGTIRQQVLGLEVVLPDGRILDALRCLRKDTGGYDLKQLFIGAEGTLGVITAVCCRLHPQPTGLRTLMVGLAGPQQALALLGQLRDRLGERVTAFELLPRVGLELVLAHMPDARDPLPDVHPWYVLLDCDIADDDGLAEIFQQLVSAGTIGDAVMAASQAQAAALWQLRGAMSAAQKGQGPSIKHDVAVPVSRLAEFIVQATAVAHRMLPDSRVLAYGHVGDGNVHFNVGCPPAMEQQRFLAFWMPLARDIHDLAVALGGTFSAEHGVGQLKVHELQRLRAGVEIDLMRTLKHTLDPNGIMNPGKVLMR